MAQYIGFSTVRACLPLSTNQQLQIGDVDYVNNNYVDKNGNPISINGYGIPAGLNASTGKKFTLTDIDLVVQDFINLLNIPIGSIPGRPDFGTTIWNFIFEPNTDDTVQQIQDEIKRVVSLDSRIVLGYVRAFPQNSGILLETQIAVQPYNNPTSLSVALSRNTRLATVV
jgi:phage baseplate assembly protein W